MPSRLRGALLFSAAIGTTLVLVSLTARASNMRQLTANEVATLIPGSFVEHIVGGKSVYVSGGGEIFRRNGEFIYLGDRAPTHGTYRIKDAKRLLRAVGAARS